MSDDLEFIVIDDIPEYIFCIGDDEENEQVIALSGKDGAFKYEKVDELPTAGEDGVLYLVPKSHTTQTASGNPINVNITDNAGKIESLKLDGGTFQQSYTGKNLFNKNDTGILDDVRVSTSNGKTYGSVGSHVSYFIKVEPSTTYALTTGRTAYYAWYSAPSEDSYISGSGWGDEYYFASPANAQYIRFDFTDGNIIQFVKGTLVGDYEPYVGGQPSPNPSYPQDINVVTGTQTISINGTNYPISLGSLELCKIGDYQDYIYKDGDDWKVHKEIGEVTLDGSETWTKASANSGYRFWTSKATDIKTSIDAVLKANRLGVAQGDTWDNYGISGSYSTNPIRLYIRDALFNDMTAEQLRGWLATHNIIAYYALATATDTTITDTNLIAQLEAIRTAALESGSNTISNTATGTNLAGDLEIGYYGYDPLNKYDKYFWRFFDA